MAFLQAVIDEIAPLLPAPWDQRVRSSVPSEFLEQCWECSQERRRAANEANTPPITSPEEVPF